MSANSTVTTRRSSVADAITSCPQNGQKRAPSGSDRKHEEHVPLAGIRLIVRHEWA